MIFWEIFGRGRGRGHFIENLREIFKKNRIRILCAYYAPGK